MEEEPVCTIVDGKDVLSWECACDRHCRHQIVAANRKVQILALDYLNNQHTLKAVSFSRPDGSVDLRLGLWKLIEHARYFDRSWLNCKRAGLRHLKVAVVHMQAAIESIDQCTQQCRTRSIQHVRHRAHAFLEWARDLVARLNGQPDCEVGRVLYEAGRHPAAPVFGVYVAPGVCLYVPFDESAGSGVNASDEPDLGTAHQRALPKELQTVQDSDVRQLRQPQQQQQQQRRQQDGVACRSDVAAGNWDQLLQGALGRPSGGTDDKQQHSGGNGNLAVDEQQHGVRERQLQLDRVDCSDGADGVQHGHLQHQHQHQHDWHPYGNTVAGGDEQHDQVEHHSWDDHEHAATDGDQQQQHQQDWIYDGDAVANCDQQHLQLQHHTAYAYDDGAAGGHEQQQELRDCYGYDAAAADGDEQQLHVRQQEWRAYDDDGCADDNQAQRLNQDSSYAIWTDATHCTIVDASDAANAAPQRGRQQQQQRQQDAAVYPIGYGEHVRKAGWYARQANQQSVYRSAAVDRVSSWDATAEDKTGGQRQPPPPPTSPYQPQQDAGYDHNMPSSLWHAPPPRQVAVCLGGRHADGGHVAHKSIASATDPLEDLMQQAAGAPAATAPSAHQQRSSQQAAQEVHLAPIPRGPRPILPHANQDYIGAQHPSMYPVNVLPYGRPFPSTAAILPHGTHFPAANAATPLLVSPPRIVWSAEQPLQLLTTLQGPQRNGAPASHDYPGGLGAVSASPINQQAHGGASSASAAAMPSAVGRLPACYAPSSLLLAPDGPFQERPTATSYHRSDAPPGGPFGDEHYLWLFREFMRRATGQVPPEHVTRPEVIMGMIRLLSVPSPTTVQQAPGSAIPQADAATGQATGSPPHGSPLQA